MVHTKMSNAQTYVTYEYEMFSSDLMLHTKTEYVRNYVTRENMVSVVRFYVTYENV